MGQGRGEQDQDATDTTKLGAASNLAGPIKDLGITTTRTIIIIIA